MKTKRIVFSSRSISDQIIDNAISAAQNHKVVLSSHNRSVNSSVSNSSRTIDPPAQQTDENGFTIPNHRIVHRGEFDIQDLTNSFLPQVRSMRPKELVVEIDLPLCASSSNVDLDVCERTLKLHCDSPKYSLDLTLPFPVRESESHARFDKKQRKLIVTLAVIKETPSIVEITSEDVQIEQTMEEENVTTPMETSPSTNNQIVPSVDSTPVINVNSIPFEYKQGLAHFALVLYVKNVDQSSFKLENDGQHLTVELSSFGSGCYPLHHKLCLDFDEPLTFETNENVNSVTFNPENVLILLKKNQRTEKIETIFQWNRPNRYEGKGKMSKVTLQLGIRGKTRARQPFSFSFLHLCVSLFFFRSSTHIFDLACETGLFCIRSTRAETKRIFSLLVC